MNILVTGGAGYIGSHASLSLLDKGYNVTIIDDLSTGHIELIPKKAIFIKCNINDTNIIASLLNKKKFFALMHFAGFVKVEESVKFPKKYFINNSINSKKLFDVCIKNGLTNIIFSSTASVYESTSNNLINENTNLNPLNPYAKSKIKTENYLRNMHKKQKINYIILRYFNVAGADPNMRSGLISKQPTHLIKIASEAAIGKRDKVTIFGTDYDTKDGTAIRDYIHVSDLADIHVKSLKYLIEKKQSLTINCGYGKGYSVKEVLDLMNKICKNRIKTEYGPRRPGDPVELVSDISKLKQKINWIPNYDDLKIILTTAIQWELKLINEKIL